jgi:NAD(P)-dependent dehydrogenase (short-subunit alcohol dehydrogenase family)
LPPDGSEASDPSGTPSAFLVSGGSGGIGAAICELLASRGYVPVVGYHRNVAAAEAIAKRCGGRALALDLSDPQAIVSGVNELEALAPLAGVVLAGSPPPALQPFGKITPEEMELQWRVNVLGPQQLLAELVRRCFRKQKKGSVVGVLTRAMGEAQTPASAGMGAYVIAKHGMAGVLAALAADYPWLRVRSVKPGYTETRMLSAFDERFLAMQREKISFDTPEAVASLIIEEALGT